MSRDLYLITPHARSFPVDPDADYIGIDAGVFRIMEQGLPVLKALGDFDSVEAGQKLPEDVILYPVKKDWSDSELAMELAVELNRKQDYRRIVLWGGISERLDHTYANIRLISWRFPQIELEDEKQKVFVLEKGRHALKSNPDHVSFFALCDSIISLENFLYPLDHKHLDQSSVLTLSNHFKNREDGIVTVFEGRLICIESRYA